MDLETLDVWMKMKKVKKKVNAVFQLEERASFLLKTMLANGKANVGQKMEEVGVKLNVHMKVLKMREMKKAWVSTMILEMWEKMDLVQLEEKMEGWQVMNVEMEVEMNVNINVKMHVELKGRTI
ncbi:hypothetical protein FACS189481_1300 [Clostridia bacterium]|nr:hypothetical protein FACS189481_1300 [Clostridia bacterium]